MTTEPRIENRAEQPYVAIRARVTMAGISGLADRFGEVFGWLGAHGVPPAGPPFFRYIVIDMARELEIDAGVPVPAAVAGDSDVIADVLPAGRYVTVTHMGPYSGLEAATGALLRWAGEQGLRWDMTADAGGEHWGGRVEVYTTDPSQEPDTSKWETQLGFRLAD